MGWPSPKEPWTMVSMQFFVGSFFNAIQKWPNQKWSTSHFISFFTSPSIFQVRFQMVKPLAPDMENPSPKLWKVNNSESSHQSFCIHRSGLLKIRYLKDFYRNSENPTDFRRCKSEPLSKSLNSKWDFFICHPSSSYTTVEPSGQISLRCRRLHQGAQDFTKVPMMKYTAFSGGIFHRIPYMVPWKAPSAKLQPPPPEEGRHGMQCHASCKSSKKRWPFQQFRQTNM